MKNSMTQEGTVKTGISISKALAEEADALARKMGISRSGLYAMAIRDFIKRRESASLLEKLNEVYAEPEPEDEPLVEGIKRRSRRLLDEDER